MQYQSRPRELLAKSGLDRQVGFVMKQTMGAIWGDLIATLKPFDLRPASYATLTMVEADPGCKQQDIADALGVQRPNLVQMIDVLVEAGWIDRRVNTADRRSNALTLSAAGKRHLRAARAAHDGHEARIAAALGAGGAERLVATLGELRAMFGTAADPV